MLVNGINTYPEMNETIKDLLKMSSENKDQYILARILELEEKVNRYEKALKLYADENNCDEYPVHEDYVINFRKDGDSGEIAKEALEEMNLQKLFEAQKKLDEHIEKEHPRQEGEDRLAKKILALQVELGELAQEWRGFKYWRHDQEPRFGGYCGCDDGYVDIYLGHGEVGQKLCPQCEGEGTLPNRVLEEYVDCLHFILSIAIELGYKTEDLYVWDGELEGETVDVFIELMYWTSRISSNDKFKRRAAFRTVCYIFFNLGERLGFTWDQIEEAYMKKNAENHERQETGY